MGVGGFVCLWRLYVHRSQGNFSQTCYVAGYVGPTYVHVGYPTVVLRYCPCSGCYIQVCWSLLTILSGSELNSTATPTSTAYVQQTV